MRTKTVITKTAITKTAITKALASISTRDGSCRGWMIAGGSIEILENGSAEAVFERSFSQRPGKGVMWS